MRYTAYIFIFTCTLIGHYLNMRKYWGNILEFIGVTRIYHRNQLSRVTRTNFNMAIFRYWELDISRMNVCPLDDWMPLFQFKISSLQQRYLRGLHSRLYLHRVEQKIYQIHSLPGGAKEQIFSTLSREILLLYQDVTCVHLLEVCLGSF